jgi:outer membrane protein OmpA-like peptidoglycan-associated protein
VARTEGADPRPQVLSDARASAVALLLSQAGVTRHPLAVKGFGDSQAVASDNTPACLAVNRRVAIKLL